MEEMMNVGVLLELQELEHCLQLCRHLGNALENDSDLVHRSLDGDVYEAYCKVVSHEQELLGELQRILLVLRESAMLSGI